jgi:hypothetical protein
MASMLQLVRHPDSAPDLHSDHRSANTGDHRKYHRCPADTIKNERWLTNHFVVKTTRTDNFRLLLFNNAHFN